MRILSLLLVALTFASCENKKSETIGDQASDAKMIEKSESKSDSWPLGESTPIRKSITEEEFQKFHNGHLDEVGTKCAEAAMTYCGKQTKDLELSETELICLWQRVYRVTREVLPKLDNTPCAELIKSAPGKEK